MNYLRYFVLSLLLVFLIYPHLPVVRADELEDITRQVQDLSKALDLSKNATKPLESELQNLTNKVTNIRLTIGSIQKDLTLKGKDLETAESALGEQKKVMDLRIKQHYKTIRSADNSVTDILLPTALAGYVREFFYQKKATDNEKELIVRMIGHITNIEHRKQELQDEQTKLSALKQSIDNKASFLFTEIVKAKSYQSDLTKQIATLSAKQQSIISARSGTAITSVGEVPIGSDFNASAAFKGQAPGNSFAVFSFGAYTHRNGMSQYGAKARADAGQSAKDILLGYFPGASVNENASIPDTIDVQGFGTISFKDYLLGIYEMPESWPLEALKAQAVLARTYAMKTGKPICTTEACQVYKNSPKSGAWKTAVEQTEHWVLENSSNAQYSSTTGGYTNTAGWDTNDKSHTGDWTTKAWESKAGSPWFYKAWYRKGYQNASDSCGRSHPWLSQEEFSDIINAWIVRKNPNGADTGRIIPVTIGSCGVGGVSGSPYSMQELRDAANNSGGAVTSVSSVSVSHGDNGQTSSVNLETNKGSLSISGAEFKETFNLRAPGYISIPQTGFAFFNIEKN
ncbi:MAG: SpoIID/LytB domain-containing protein [Candidatus Roizmanbacteria bacterium]